MKPILAIVVPCYNEQEVLPSSDKSLGSLLRDMISGGLVAPQSFILYVDDGSRDATWSFIANASASSPNVEGLKLAGNVGHQNALLAGMEAATGYADAIITIDADLQDDIDVIPEMVRQFIDGSDIVYGIRRNRDSDSRFKRQSAQSYYRMLGSMGVKTIYNHADFRLMSRRAVKNLLEYGERNMYLRGIVPTLGFRQSEVYYDRKPRLAGETKYPLRKMLNFAVEGITSFSVRPVRLVFFIGLAFILVALGIFIYVLIRYFGGETIEGWTSLMLSIWFCTGITLISLGIIGEYVGKIYLESKHRPRYFVETFTLKNNSCDS